MDKPSPENPREPLETSATILVPPEAVDLERSEEATSEENPEIDSAELAYIKAKAAVLDADLTKTLLEVGALRPNADESKRVDELNWRENTAKAKFYRVMGTLENLYWKAREIGQSPKKVRAIRLIAQARQKRWGKNNIKEQSDAERTQMMLEKIKRNPREEYDKKNPMVKKVEAKNPLIRSIDNWTPTLDDNDDNAIAYLVHIKMKMDDMRDEFRDDPSAENVKKEIKLIFEITGTSPTTDEEVKRVWEAGLGGAIMRSGEERIGDYFAEMAGSYPEIYMELNKKRGGLPVKEDEQEGVAKAKKILGRIDYLPHVEGGYDEGGKTLPPPGARRRALRPPTQPEA